MIVAILLSYLSRINQRRHFRDVWLGVAAAMVLVLAGGFGAFFLIKQYEGSNVQTYFETATYVIAAGVLTGMTYWMHKHARTMASELQARSDLALTKGPMGLGVLSFQAVVERVSRRWSLPSPSSLRARARRQRRCTATCCS